MSFSGIEVLVEFEEAAWIGREHKISPTLYLRSHERHVVARGPHSGLFKKTGRACDRCGRTKCRCGKKFRWSKKS